jgi:quercetin dioxygenase-like cupin family protein
VTAGCGWVQAWGEPVQLVRPGDVVWFAPGEKHGHGATAVTGMSHVAVQEAHGGVSAACLEPVPEETYRAGPPPA